MSSGIIRPTPTQETGSNQFSGLQFDFLDTFSSLPSGAWIRLHTVAYNSQGSAHAFTCYLAESASADADEWIEIKSSSSGNSFFYGCDLDVPVKAGASFVMLFTTTGKTGDGTLQVTYSVQM